MYGVRHVHCDCGHSATEGETIYFIDGESYCEGCVDDQLSDIWNEKNTIEKLELLDGYCSTVTSLCGG